MKLPVRISFDKTGGARVEEREVPTLPSPVPLTFHFAAWKCPKCGCFNGEAKETLWNCRNYACNAPRPLL